MGADRSGLPAAAQVALAVGLCALLGVPAVLPPGTQTAEKRVLAPRPEFSWSTSRGYSNRYEQYFNDHFGLRQALVRTHNYLKVKVFKVSPLPRVIVGRAGWLFVDEDARHGRESLRDYRGRASFSPPQLERVGALLSAEAAWLRGRGIAFGVLVCPDKPSVYPEHLPASVGRKGARTRLDQLSAHLAGRQVPFVDSRAALLRAKGSGPLYYRTDSHWNQLGAFVGYQALVERVREDLPSLPPLRLEDFTVRAAPASKRGGDLAVMLLLDRFLADDEVSVNPAAGRAADGRKLGKVLVFHDSFVRGFEPLLRLQFREVVLNRGTYRRRVVEKTKPDLVIVQMVERHQGWLQRMQVGPP